MGCDLFFRLATPPPPPLPRISPASRRLHLPLHRIPRPIKHSSRSKLTTPSPPPTIPSSPPTPILPVTDAADRRTLTHSPGVRAADADDKHNLRSYSSLLQTCASRRSTAAGAAVHARLLRTGVDPDNHLWVSLLNMYSKCGRTQCALKAFDEMPERDVISWTVLISGYASEGNGRQGIVVYQEMIVNGVEPNVFAVAAGLKASAFCSYLDFGRQVHAEAIKLQFLSDLYIGSSLVDLYVKCGEMELAEKVLFTLPERNEVSWNALLNGYAQAGNDGKVIEVFRKVMEMEVQFSKFTLMIVLKCCVGLVDLRRGREIHALMIKFGMEVDEFLSSRLVDVYSKCGSPEDAYRVFLGIEDPDVVQWSTMISCFDRLRFNTDAIELFREMNARGVKPNQFTLTTIASVASDLGDQWLCGSVHASIIKSRFEMENAVGNAIVDMYMRTGATRDGCLMFDAMVVRDVVSWNSLLSGFHSGSFCTEGLRIFNEMLIENIKANEYTFVSLLRSCSTLREVGCGAQVHAHIFKNGLHEVPFVGTALVDMYSNCGHLSEACIVFDRLKQKDVFTWTIVITGYSKNDQGEKAMKCYQQMQREGMSPNNFTLASCLRACSALAALNSGQQLHSWSIKSGQCDVFVLSSLVDMYLKCGCLEDAEAAFDGSSTRDLVSWNTIICGYSQHGYAEKALKSFQCMIKEGMRPDKITFIGVLSACSRTGLFDEGCWHFYSMTHLYGITPTIEHHACMVDILGRAGRLVEVESFIDEMTLAPNASIWQTVLAACRVHGNVGFGERAAAKLFELEPYMDSAYVLLSNIYAGAERWADVASVRTMMSNRRVKKEPGCSWIEVNSRVHVFLAQDRSHPMTKEIYQKFKELNERICSEGYILDTKYLLYDANDADDEKENLLYHSERLALAFGLINANSVNPIRIFKNLRICGDCHNAIKFISSITSREFIIRDISRFHHFKNGFCSCHDYW